MRLRFRNNIAAVIIVLMMFFAFNLSGVGTVRSATRMGYVTNESHSNWSASYTLLDGTMRRTVYPSKPAEVSGKVVVHIVADHHKGSFQISG